MFDTRAVRQALKALGSEPAPVPVDGPERVVLAGGGNEVAMSLYRALGRGTSELSEAQVRQRQEAMLVQFEREAQQVLSLIGAFRTVISLDSRRAVPAAEGKVLAATGTGQEVVPAPVAVEAGRSYAVVTAADLKRREHPPIAAEPRASEPDDPETSGVAPYSVVRGRVAPDMESCTDCGKLVAWEATLGHYIHVDEPGFHAYGLDGHVVHGDKLTHAPLHPQHMVVQQGPAMDTEEEAKAIVKRAVEAAQRDIDASRARAAHHDRDSGIEPGSLDSTELDLSPIEPGVAGDSLVGRVRKRVARWVRRLDGYTERKLEDIDQPDHRSWWGG